MGRIRGAFVSGAVLGGLAGAAVTLWRAPQPGRVTRSQIGGQLVGHAGPLAPALIAVGEGLDQAGTTIVTGVNIVTRFIEELIDPSLPGVAPSAPDAAPDLPSSALEQQPALDTDAATTSTAASLSPSENVTDQAAARTA